MIQQVKRRFLCGGNPLSVLGTGSGMAPVGLTIQGVSTIAEAIEFVRAAGETLEVHYDGGEGYNLLHKLGGEAPGLSQVIGRTRTLRKFGDAEDSQILVVGGSITCLQFSIWTRTPLPE